MDTIYYELRIDKIKVQTDKQFVYKDDIINLAVKIGTVPEEIKNNFNCYIINGTKPDIEILNPPNDPIDLNCLPRLRIYTCGMTIL